MQPNRSEKRSKPGPEAQPKRACGACDPLSELGAELWREPLHSTALRERLLGLTEPLRTCLHQARPLEKEWAALGVEVREKKMRVLGRCYTAGGSRVINVNQDESYEVQRFTVAHEVAHLLLASGPRRGNLLSAPAEEILCEEFAGRLLVDRERLRLILGHDGSPPSPEEILRLCGQFRVNVRPMLIAVGELLSKSQYCLLLSRWRGHRRRPEELAFRVERTAGRQHAYFPPSQRLTSLGLRQLADSAERALHGETFEGAEEEVSVELRGLRGTRSSASARGPVRWRAIRQGKDAPFLIAVLDLGQVPNSVALPTEAETPAPGILACA